MHDDAGNDVRYIGGCIWLAENLQREMDRLYRVAGFGAKIQLVRWELIRKWQVTLLSRPDHWAVVLVRPKEVYIEAKCQGNT